MGGLKRLVGDSGKTTYTTYPWRHISDFKTTTLGAMESFSVNQETELDVKLSSDEWLHLSSPAKLTFSRLLDTLAKPCFRLILCNMPICPYYRKPIRLRIRPKLQVGSTRLTSAHCRVPLVRSWPVRNVYWSLFLTRRCSVLVTWITSL